MCIYPSCHPKGAGTWGRKWRECGSLLSGGSRDLGEDRQEHTAVTMGSRMLGWRLAREAPVGPGLSLGLGGGWTLRAAAALSLKGRQDTGGVGSVGQGSHKEAGS